MTDYRLTGLARKWFLPFAFIPLVLILIYLKFSAGWHGDRRFTVVFHNIYPETESGENDLALVSLEPSSQRGIYLYISPKILLDLPYGYKTYPSSSVFRLGALESGDAAGGHLLQKSLELSLGVKTDAFVAAKNNWFDLSKNKGELDNFKRDNFTLYKGLPFLFRLLTDKYVSNLNFSEKIRFFLKMRKIRLDQLEFVNLAESSSVYPEILPDKTEVWHIDQINFDHNNFSRFEDRLVRLEDISLEVENASDEEKVATLFARVLKNYGVKVVARLTAKKIMAENCLLYLYSGEAAESHIAEIMVNDYNCRQEKRFDENSQADIRVVLGEKFIK